MKTQEVSFKVKPSEAITIAAITTRAIRAARDAGFKYSRLDADMDITACHANGCPLNLEKLLTAPDFDFAHDIFGIRRHLDRETGELRDRFLPRSATRKGA